MLQPTSLPINPLADFLSRVLRRTPSNSPEAIKERLKFWIERANDPQIYSTEKTRLAIADVRRKARQNVRRLATRHSEVAAQLATEMAIHSAIDAKNTQEAS